MGIQERKRTRKQTRYRNNKPSYRHYDEWVDHHYHQFLRSNKKKDMKYSSTLQVTFIEMHYIDSRFDHSSYSLLEHGYILYKPLLSQKVELYLYKGNKARLEIERAIALKIALILFTLVLLIVPIVLILQ